MTITVQSPAPGRGAPAADAGDDRLPGQRLKHDMRQSLTAVMTLAAIVDKSLDRTPEVLRRLDQIRHETEWMIQLVSASGACAGDREALEVGDVVAEAWRSVASTSTCAVRLVRDAGARACVDRAGLTRSVRNLLNNAVRAAGEDGRVVVEVRVEPTTVDLVVGDNGPGFGKIPAQQGLGLLTVRQFAAEHHGEVEVCGDRSTGAQVTLRLPRLSPSPPGPEESRCGS